MPCSFSTDCAQLCKHTSYQIGCVSCSAHDIRGEVEEANSAKANREEQAKGYRAALEARDTLEQDRTRLAEQLRKAEEQRDDWDERCIGQQRELSSVELKVKALCDGVDDPSALSEAFDNDAAESEDALRQLWRSNEGAIGQDFVEMFCREDRTRQLSSAARDPSTIPAPPDSLINDGLGFQVFLQAGRGLGRSPKDAVGEQTGPATIAYGRLGGLLEGSEPSAASPIEDTLERCSIAAASADTAADQPRTTEQARSQQGVGESSKASTVTDDERWELFRKNKFGPDAALLARHYVASVLAKESQNSKKVKKSDEGSTSDQAEAEAEVEVESSVDEWPAVGQLTFKDFTTWIIACKSADRKFGPVTMKSWRAQRQERHDTLSARLSAWEPPNGFGDGSSQYPKPKQYYNGKTLLALDLHIKSKPTKR